MSPNPSRYIFAGLIILFILGYLFALAIFSQSQNTTRERDTALTQVALQATTLATVQTRIAPASPTLLTTQPTIAPTPTADQSAPMAFSREIAAQAIDRLQIDPELSLLLSTEAMRVADTDQARYALRRSLVESNLRIVLRENNGPVYKAIYSPDGKYIATGGKDGNARIWDAATGRLLATLDAQVSEYSLGMFGSFVFNPEGSLLVTIGNPGIVKMWQVPGGNLVRVLSGETPRVPIVGVAFSPDRKWLMGIDCNPVDILSCQMVVRVWSTETWQTVSRVEGPTGGFPAGISFSPDSQLMLVASLGGSNILHVWQVGTWQSIGEMKEHKKPIIAAVFSPNSQYILSASTDEDVRLWEPRSPITYSRQVAKSTGYPGIAFSPDGRYLAIAGQDAILHIFHTDSMEWARILAGTPLYSVAFNPDGKSIMAVGEDNTVRIWDWNSSQPAAVLRGDTARIITAMYSPNGQSLVTASDDGTARVWATTTQLPDLSSWPNDGIMSVEYSPNGKYILVANHGGLVQVQDALSLVPIAKLQSGFEYLRDATFSPDGQSIAIASFQKNAIIWNWQTDQVRQLAAPMPNGGIAYSPDGKYLVTAHSDATARVWNPQTGEKIVELDKHLREVSSAHFSSDSQFLVTTSFDTARVYQVSDWKIISEWSGFGDHMYTGVFSPDGQYVITGSTGQKARVWEWRKKQLVAELQSGRPRFQVSAIAFSPDGNLVVTAGEERVLFLWDARTWQLITTLAGHFYPIRSVGFSPDGRYIVSAGDTFTVHACQVCAPIQTLVNLARQRSTRDLTCNERRAYLHQAVECPTMVPRR